MTPTRTRPTLPSMIIPQTPPHAQTAQFSDFPDFAQFSTPPCTTPGSYDRTPSPSSSTSSSSYFSPASPTILTPRHGQGDREIMMGGLVSRSGSPRSSDEFDEKRQGSIEVPGIVLSKHPPLSLPSPSNSYSMLLAGQPAHIPAEPLPDLPPRTPSPPPKHILLLPPTSLPIPAPGTEPTYASYSSSSTRPLSPAFLTLIHGNDRRKSSGALTTARGILILGAIALGAWHLWSTFDISTLVEDVADGL